jgi:F-type H+-transporting ATPase subunit delta
VSQETIAERYAQAIFDLGVETSSLAQLTEDIRKVAEAYQDSTDLQRLMKNPLVAEDARLAIVRELGERLGVSPLAQNALGLITKRKRTFALPAIASELHRLADEKSGVVRATVISAEPLSDEYAARLTQELSALTGKQVVLARQQDPELMAGVVVRLGDQVLDGSVRTRIQELKSQLLSA